MIEKLKENLKNSYAPYSNFHVSAILKTRDDKEYKGVNIENASFGATICAERVAITKALSEGENPKNFKEIHIMCDSEDKGMPCFLCRQVFVEFFEKDVKIFVYNNKGEHSVFTLEEVCPYPFSKEDIKWKADL